jgi:outer membrane protein OmpA-like peptidoglycan-associated protein
MVRKFASVVILILVSVSLHLVATTGVALQQDKLEEASKLLEEAKAGQADILSPETYSRAEKAYNEAVKKTEKGESLDKIRKLLDEAIGLASTAIRNTDLAKVTFVEVLPARQKALEANAPSLVKEAWEVADKEFYEAANSLEDGDASDAKKKAAEASDLFLNAELLAIKEDVIGETNRRIDKLVDEDVEKTASQTIEKAKQHLRKAEEILDGDRYRKEDAGALNKVARYEAEHANDLARRIVRNDKEKVSQEKVYLDFEENLMMIGNEIGVSLQFDEGIQAQAELLRQELAELKNERNNLAAELEDLRRKYAGTQEDRRAIDEQLRQERVKRERVERISALFEADEAKILQEGTRVIIRLAGFTFPSGTSVIEPQFFPLLTKVQKSIGEFPTSHIAIEGHTDSKGEDTFNQKLSQKRADAIRTYLVANLGINPGRIVAVGYGESKPIASNDTNQGRAMNRRVDVVIEPGD